MELTLRYGMWELQYNTGLNICKYNIGIKHGFHVLVFAMPWGRCWEPRVKSEGFYISWGPGIEKQCLILIQRKIQLNLWKVWHYILSLFYSQQVIRRFH